MELSITEAVLRIAAALVLGAMVGLERELSLHPAGLRTHILVSMGSAVFTILSISNLALLHMDPSSVPVMPEGVDYRMVQDPGRIAAQVVAGIGFIGGGAVLRHGATIRGLTTAASLWMIASIGMLAGSGNYLLAFIATVMSLLVLYLLGKLGRNLTGKHQKPYDRLRLLISTNSMYQEDLQNWATRQFEDQILEVKSTASNEGTATMTFVVDITNIKVDVNEISKSIQSQTGVMSSGIRMYYQNLDED